MLEQCICTHARTHARTHTHTHYPDQLSTPVNTATFSNSTTAVLTVSFDPQCCNTAQLNVDTTTNSSSATTPVVLPVDSTDPTNTAIVITDITEGVSYTASIWSVCRDANNLLEDSGVLVVNFMTNGEYVHPCVHMSVYVPAGVCMHVHACVLACVEVCIQHTYVHIPTILCWRLCMKYLYMSYLKYTFLCSPPRSLACNLYQCNTLH